MDTILSESVGFHAIPPTVMHIDLNSCFASCEQQADYLLRGKPVAVGAYVTPGGCILAASYEAKAFGVQTGMRVSEGKRLCPGLIVLPCDPPKYRYINRKLLALFHEYTADVFVKSIDEMVLLLEHSPALRGRLSSGLSVVASMEDIAREIKSRITSEIGDALRVSIGISTNRYLAKVASGMEKPNGLTVIEASNVLHKLGTFQVIEELNGIKKGYGNRLRAYGITNPLEFYHASIDTLKQAFHSIVGYHWWLRLHGFEADDREFDQKSIGHSYALYQPYQTDDVRLHQILCQLSEKMARRVRKNGYEAQGIHLGILYATYRYWHMGRKLSEPRYAGSDMYKEAMSILRQAPNEPVRTIDVSCHYFRTIDQKQQYLFDDDRKKQRITQAIDAIQDRWGECSIMPGSLLDMPNTILDRIAFGSVAELEESVFHEKITRESWCAF